MKKKKVVEEELKVVNFIKIILGVILVFAIFYGITSLVTNKEEKKGEEAIQYNKIIVGSILNRLETEYYVLVEASEDSEVSTYEALISTYTHKDEHLRVYKVDLSDPFNSKYVADESNLSVDNIADIRFNKTVLLHIKDKKIVSYREGNDINTYLTNLSA